MLLPCKPLGRPSSSLSPSPSSTSLCNGMIHILYTDYTHIISQYDGSTHGMARMHCLVSSCLFSRLIHLVLSHFVLSYLILSVFYDDVDPTISEDADLAGPLCFCLLLGTCLLLVRYPPKQPFVTRSNRRLLYLCTRYVYVLSLCRMHHFYLYVPHLGNELASIACIKYG